MITPSTALKKISSEFDRSSMAESFEYLMTGVISVPLQSIVSNIKRTGAKTVPCGAPVDVQSWDESTNWKRTDWVLFSKK